MTSPETRKAGTREWIGLAVLALGCLLYVMDLTVLHLAVPSISEDLQPSSSQLLWIIDIYGFMVAGFLVTMGTLGDRIGRRRLLLTGSAAFGALSVLAAFSTSPEMLITSRALLGIAGATIGPGTLSLIFNMFQDPGQRARAIAIWISAFSAGSAIGPVLGGVLLEHFWWGSVFLLGLPVIALLLILGPIVLPEYKDPNANRLDLSSVVMSLVAVLSVIFGLKQVAQDGIGPVAVTTVVVGLVVGGLWVRRQLTLADPMLDVRLFRIPSFSASLVVNFLSIFVAVGYFLFVAQYLQLVLGLSPLQAGMWSVPSAVGFIVGSNVAPRIVRLLRPAYVMGAGLALSAVGLGIIAQVGGANGLAMVVLGSIVISLGLAPVLSLTTELIVGSAPPERAGAASGISETGAELGGALGISILGSIGVSIYRGELGNSLPALPVEATTVAKDTLGGAVAVAAHLPDGVAGSVLTIARDAFVQGMQLAAAISGVVAIAVAVFAVLVLRDVRSGTAEATGDTSPDENPEMVHDRGAGTRAHDDRERGFAQVPMTCAPGAEA
jgi:DHA2 family multidrug resistance protein-like MFS transporter